MDNHSGLGVNVQVKKKQLDKKSLHAKKLQCILDNFLFFKSKIYPFWNTAFLCTTKIFQISTLQHTKQNACITLEIIF